jgi:hypothetical protein
VLKDDMVRPRSMLKCELLTAPKSPSVKSKEAVDNIGSVSPFTHRPTGWQLYDRIDKGFNPLSYVFGNASDLVTINCNGYRVRIRRNLYDALTQIWTSWPRKRIWADALCINQNDLVEKSAQISQMGQIYAGSEVLVWLGKEADHIRSAWELIDRLADHEVTVPYNIWSPPQRSIIRLDDTAHVDIYHALQDLLSRSWFHRMWTFQEIALAGGGVVMCGSLYMSWYDFYNGVIAIKHEIGEEYGFGPHYTSLIENMVNLESALTLASSYSMTLDKIMVATRRRNVTLPQDRIYSLLGLPRLSTSFKIRADYTKSPWQVFAQVTHACIESTRCPDLLGAAGLQNRATLLEKINDCVQAIAVDIADQEDGDERQMAKIKLQDDKLLSRKLPTWVPNWNDPACLERLGTHKEIDILPERLQELIPPEAIIGKKQSENGLTLRGLAFARLVEQRNKRGDLMLESFPSCLALSHRIGQKSVYPFVDFEETIQSIERHDSQDCECHRTHASGTKMRRRMRRATHLPQGLPLTSASGDWICTFHGGHACHILRFLTPARAAAVHQYMCPIADAPRRCVLVGTVTNWFSKIVAKDNAAGLAALEMDFALV